MQRFKVFQINDYDYRVSKPIIFVAFFLILALLLYVLYVDNFSGSIHYYTYCDSNGMCLNPFFNNSVCFTDVTIYDTPLCMQQFVMPHQGLGEKPSFLYSNFGMIGSWILIIALLLNNFIYNKGFFKYLFQLIREGDDESDSNIRK